LRGRSSRTSLGVQVGRIAGITVHVDWSLLIISALTTPVGWGWALFVWGYSRARFLLNDRVKLAACRVFDRRERGLLQQRPAVALR